MSFVALCALAAFAVAVTRARVYPLYPELLLLLLVLSKHLFLYCHTSVMLGAIDGCYVDWILDNYVAKMNFCARKLKDLMLKSDNRVCADCGAPDPKLAYGVLHVHCTRTISSAAPDKKWPRDTRTKLGVRANDDGDPTTSIYGIVLRHDCRPAERIGHRVIPRQREQSLHDDEERRFTM
ncbi:hypothetical protein GUJ93_ZPchr0013g36512 [Zizania palustris]|uniref:Secreted protein n=1 Tax=Zizania palustris TaxID=103762 RepID=A0A8J5WYV5_ZIZPA|nr:hypothetical protein GUJ93_ZPchr0013g36512 [Zizania palustris]